MAETFTWIPQFTFSEDVDFVTLISKGEKGKERRRSKRSTAKRKFTLTFNVLTSAVGDAIYAFYIARKGATETFNWTNSVTGTVYTDCIRFEHDNLSREYFTKGRYKLTINFIQVL